MTPEDARDALHEVQGLRCDDVQPLRGGWAYWTFAVDGIWIVRFPRDAAVASETAKELVLLPLLARKVDFGVPLPAWRGTHRGWPFFGYRKIPGHPLGAEDLREHPQLAGELAHALRELHAVPLEDARQATPALGTAEAWRAKYERLGLSALQRIGPLLDARAAKAMAERLAAFAAELQYTPALVHCDLGLEHLLIDGDGHLAGIIDWEDASVGDPAIDFAGLWRAMGGEATGRILAAYPAVVGDAPLEARIMSYAWIAEVHDILHGLDAGDADMVAQGITRLQTALHGVPSMRDPGLPEE